VIFPPEECLGEMAALLISASSLPPVIARMFGMAASIVLISATLSGQVDLVESIRWGGADAFLREPVEPESMVSTLWRVIRAA